MTDYTITTDFGAKDSLPSGNAAKVIKGSEFTTEFTNILTAVNSKADTAGDTFTGAVTFDAAVTLNADVTFDTNTMFVDVSENRVGIGTTSPATALDVTGTVTASGIALSDNEKATFGAGSDLEIYHSGSNSFVKDVGQGNLLLDTNGSLAGFTSDGVSKYMALFNKDASVDLYYDNSKKLATTSTGIDVTGTVTASGLTVDTDTLHVDATNDRVGIGTTSPLKDLNVSNTTGSSEIMISTSDTGTGSLEFGDVTSGAVARGFLKYNHSDNSLQFGSAQTERMRIDASGKLLLNTTTHTLNDSEMVVASEYSASGTTTGGITLSSRQSGAWRNSGIFANGTSLTFTTGDTGVNGAQSSSERMRIDSSGNVGIGTTSPSYPLDIAGASGTTLSVRNTSTISSILLSNGSSANQIFSRGANSSTGRDLAFVQGTSEAMRIDSSGNLLVGTTSYRGDGGSGAKGFYAGSDGLLSSARSGATVAVLNRTTSDGTIVDFRKDGLTVGSISVTGSATAYNTSSDERLKENIQDSTDAGSKIDAIQIRQFDWKSDGSHQDYGVVAQELINVAPEAVSEGDTEEDMMGVDYSKLVPMLIKEVQTLRNRVAQLENN